MEKLGKSISDFMKNHIFVHILADVHQPRANNADVRFDRVERSLTGLAEQLGSMKIGGGGMIRDAMQIAEAAMEIETSDGDEKFGVGLEMGKRKVGLVEWVVSVRPLLLETLSVSVTMKSDYDGGVKTKKLVILDDVWTREALDHLTSNLPGCTTLVVSRSKLVEPNATYDVEVLREYEAISLICLCAFGQKSVPPGFDKDLVKKVAGECKGLPLALKVTGASLKDRPEQYWQGALLRLSRGEPTDETHETRLLHRMEASLEDLDSTARECFLDLGAFPKDRKIPVDVLINMWTEMHDLDELGSLYASYYDVFVTHHDVLREREMGDMHWSNFDMDFPKAEILILNFSSDKFCLLSSAR
ncbi:hypothetical protein Bca4012_086694 [Brassica carinata]|nr:unnamed protein product [Brassica napus]